MRVYSDSGWQWAGRSGLNSRGSAFSLRHQVQTGSGAYPHLCNEYLGVKRPKLETDRSPSSDGRVKNEWMYISSPTRLHGVILSYGWNFAFTWYAFRKGESFHAMCTLFRGFGLHLWTKLAKTEVCVWDTSHGLEFRNVAWSHRNFNPKRHVELTHVSYWISSNGMSCTYMIENLLYLILSWGGHNLEVDRISHVQT
jgi:hypothetical protein